MTNHYQMGYDEGALAAREGLPSAPSEAVSFPTDSPSGEREEFLAGYAQGYQDTAQDIEHIHGHDHGHAHGHNHSHGHNHGHSHGLGHPHGHTAARRNSGS